MTDQANRIDTQGNTQTNRCPCLETQENLDKTTSALRLIFWGVIICVVRIEINGFDIINDFIGMLLIFWGTATLTRRPVSSRYIRQMRFPLMVALVVCIAVLLGELFVLYRLSSGQKPTPPGMLPFLVFTVALLACAWGSRTFCVCMKEYCTFADWDKATKSWSYSLGLLFYGVVLPLTALALPFLLLVSSVQFVSENPSWSFEQRDGQHITKRDGVVVRTEPFVIGKTYGTSDLEDHGAMYIRYSRWKAPISRPVSTAMTVVMLPCCVMLIWTIIHFLMSVSRMIYCAESQLARLSMKTADAK